MSAPPTDSHATHKPLRIFYAASVGAIAGFPFLAPILVDAGLEKAHTALLFLVFPLCKLIVAPAVAMLVDRIGHARHTLSLCALAAMLSTILIASSSEVAWLCAGVCLLAIANTPIFPLGDAMTVRVLGSQAKDYGSIRAWGSGTLVLLVLLVGWLSDTAGRMLLLPTIVGFAATAIASQRLPQTDRAAGPKHRPSPLLLLREPTTLLLVAIAVVHGATFTTYDKLFTMHVDLRGHAGWVAGAGIALGIATETVILWKARYFLERWGAPWTLLSGIAIGIVRWWITAHTTSAFWLAAVQCLHGGSFGLFWIAGIHLFNARAPDTLKSTSQALFQGATLGAGQLAGMLLSALLIPIGDTPLVFTALVFADIFAALMCLPLVLQARKRQ